MRASRQESTMPRSIKLCRLASLSRNTAANARVFKAVLRRLRSRFTSSFILQFLEVYVRIFKGTASIFCRTTADSRHSGLAKTTHCQMCVVLWLRAQRPQHGAGNNMSLHLAGAVPDAFDARITPDAFQGQIAHQSH